MKPWIGVDLDGTLAVYHDFKGLAHVGPPIKAMCDRVRTWLAEGVDVRIFTARAFCPKGDVERGDHVIESFKAIDEFCIREFGRPLPITCTKDYGMIELWDDRAKQVVPNTGESVEEQRDLLIRKAGL